MNREAREEREDFWTRMTRINFRFARQGRLVRFRGGLFCAGSPHGDEMEERNVRSILATECKIKKIYCVVKSSVMSMASEGRKNEIS